MHSLILTQGLQVSFQFSEASLIKSCFEFLGYLQPSDDEDEYKSNSIIVSTTQRMCHQYDLFIRILVIMQTEALLRSPFKIKHSFLYPNCE